MSEPDGTPCCTGQPAERPQIGTRGERALHAALKRRIEPDESLHEIPCMGFVADICNASGIVEIQTRAFDRLRGKLARYLPETPVTLVYPAVRQKWLVWIDPETGEATKKRRSPKTGTPFAAFVELYKIRQLLPHPNLRIQIIPVDVEEHRSLTGWSRDRKRGSTRLERLPVAFGDAIWLATPTDYAALLPSTLTDPFTTADLAAEARLSRKAVQCTVNVMWHLGAIVRCGKRGNAYLYRRAAAANRSDRTGAPQAAPLAMPIPAQTATVPAPTETAAR